MVQDINYKYNNKRLHTSSVKYDLMMKLVPGG
jgi:hypothetical protein